jgi:hypothetical protein
VLFLDEHLLPATTANKERADRFFKSVAPRSSGNPIPALELAFKQMPDLIYYATNNLEFPDNLAVTERIHDLNAAHRVHIDVIAIRENPDSGNSQPELLLKKIAEQNGGVFRYLEILDP